MHRRLASEIAGKSAERNDPSVARAKSRHMFLVTGVLRLPAGVPSPGGVPMVSLWLSNLLITRRVVEKVLPVVCTFLFAALSASVISYPIQFFLCCLWPNSTNYPCQGHVLVFCASILHLFSCSLAPSCWLLPQSLFHLCKSMLLPRFSRSFDHMVIMFFTSSEHSSFKFMFLFSGDNSRRILSTSYLDLQAATPLSYLALCVPSKMTCPVTMYIHTLHHFLMSYSKILLTPRCLRASTCSTAMSSISRK